MEETLTYEAASARLEAIIARLDSGEAGLRETLELCREGRALVEFCAAELEAVGQGLEELRLDELVARLEGRRARPPSRRRARSSGPQLAAQDRVERALELVEPDLARDRVVEVRRAQVVGEPPPGLAALLDRRLHRVDAEQRDAAQDERQHGRAAASTPPVLPQAATAPP